MFLKKVMTYTFQSLKMTSKGQTVTFLAVWLERWHWVFCQFDQWFHTVPGYIHMHACGER